MRWEIIFILFCGKVIRDIYCTLNFVSIAKFYNQTMTKTFFNVFLSTDSLGSLYFVFACIQLSNMTIPLKMEITANFKQRLYLDYTAIKYLCGSVQ